MTVEKEILKLGFQLSLKFDVDLAAALGERISRLERELQLLRAQ